MDFSLFKPTLINMEVHSATCSCSIELYINSGILWQNFSQTGIFAGFSLNSINFAVYLCTFTQCVFNMHVCNTKKSLK